ncbi:uncharacterized protein TM35_000054070 [Trypanosoma theileri]|uniref:Uncharacterized protein n=1 Tax=Trypanosoma theileri TaxID=67003 RepID=A0A1X0P4Q1_9TRYP|nr:uncharacterized protein TM35_000054070 [Trypanosoma theileri]ORC91811.1 hypothetical protein TM35_000054070 [Trypanosoma theileri]
MDYVILKPAELILWREKAAPTIRKVTDLLLRGGAIGYLNMEQLLQKGSEEDMSISKDKRRVNPVGFKSIMQQSGILLTPDEHRNLRTAYSDEGGFLVDEFLDLVCPLRNLNESQINLLRSMCPAVVGIGIGNTSMIELNELLHAFEDALIVEDVTKAKTETKEETESAIATASLFESALLEMRMVFTSSRYPKGLVPARDVGNFCAAIVLNGGNNGMTVLQQLAKVRLQLASTSNDAANRTQTTDTYDVDPLQSSQQNKRQDRGYDYYTERDNRDEWIRGREEAAAGPMYLRHLPGYSGHLPTFKSKYGRSFHPIEESMPQLTQEKKTQPGPLPADHYGPGVELKGNPMNRHNFKFS